MKKYIVMTVLMASAMALNADNVKEYEKLEKRMKLLVKTGETIEKGTLGKLCKDRTGWKEKLCKGLKFTADLGRKTLHKLTGLERKMQELIEKYPEVRKHVLAKTLEEKKEAEKKLSDTFEELQQAEEKHADLKSAFEKVKKPEDDETPEDKEGREKATLGMKAALGAVALKIRTLKTLASATEEQIKELEAKAKELDVVEKEEQEDQGAPEAEMGEAIAEPAEGGEPVMAEPAEADEPVMAEPAVTEIENLG